MAEKVCSLVTSTPLIEPHRMCHQRYQALPLSSKYLLPAGHPCYLARAHVHPQAGNPKRACCQMCPFVFKEHICITLLLVSQTHLHDSGRLSFPVAAVPASITSRGE